MPRDQDSMAPEPHFWTGDETFKLVHRIASDPKLRDRFFPLDPNDVRAPSSLRKTEKELCLELLAETVWMDSMINLGWIYRDKRGGLEMTTSWNHGHSPVSNRLDWVKDHYGRMQGQFGGYSCPNELPFEKAALWGEVVRRRKGDWYFIYGALKARDDRMLEKLLANTNSHGITTRHGQGASPPPSPKGPSLAAGSPRHATAITKPVKRKMAEMEESAGRRSQGKMSNDGKAPDDKRETGRERGRGETRPGSTRAITPLVLDRYGAPIIDSEKIRGSSVAAPSKASGSSSKPKQKSLKTPSRAKVDPRLRNKNATSLGSKSNPIRIGKDEPLAFPLPEAGIDPLQWLCPNRIAREKRIDQGINQERRKDSLPLIPLPTRPASPSDSEIDSDDDATALPLILPDSIAITDNALLLPFAVPASSLYVPPALDFGDDDLEENAPNPRPGPPTPPLTAEYGWPVEEQELETRPESSSLVGDDIDQLAHDEPPAPLRTVKVEIKLDGQIPAIVPDKEGGELPMDIDEEHHGAERPAPRASSPLAGTSTSPISALVVGDRASPTSPGVLNLPPKPRWVTATPTSPERTSLLAERLATRHESTDERGFWIVGPRWEEVGRKQY